MRMLIIFLVLITTGSRGQDANPASREPAGADSAARQDVDSPASKAGALFRTAERGIISADFDALAPSFGKQVSMTIRGSESGYFSSAQAVTILRNYFSSRKTLQFSFTRVNESATHPYATGRLDFEVRGSKESVQVYVSVARQDSLWVISQFNIY